MSAVNFVLKRSGTVLSDVSINICSVFLVVFMISIRELDCHTYVCVYIISTKQEPKFDSW
jgi:hypothetical protein